MMELIRWVNKCLLDIGEFPQPSVVDINLTTRCNQKCLYCEIGQGLLKTNRTDKNSLNLHDLTWIIDQMEHEEIPDLVLLGGEPFLFKDLFNTLEYAYTRIKNISIITNGMLIPTLSREELMILRRSKCKMIVSLDSFDSGTHNLIRGVPNAFQNAIQAIQILVQNQIPVQVETVITQYNYRDLYDLVRNAYHLGVSSVQLIPLITSSNFASVESIPHKKDLNPKPEHINRILEQLNDIIDFEKEHTIQTNTREMRRWFTYLIAFHSNSDSNGNLFFRYRVNRFFCCTIYNRIKINAYGEIQPCNLIPPTISLHDSPDQSLVQKWNQACQHVRTAINEECYPKQCNACYSSHTRNLLISTMKYPFRNRSNILRTISDRLQKY